MNLEDLKNAERTAAYATRYGLKNSREFTLGSQLLKVLEYVSVLEKAVREEEDPPEVLETRASYEVPNTLLELLTAPRQK